MTQMEAMTDRIVAEALADARRRYEVEVTAARIHELCRDTVVAARLARLRLSRETLLDTPLCQCAPGECQGH